ncbi:MAG: CpaF family protein, partial [Pseudomonas sp.]
MNRQLQTGQGKAVVELKAQLHRYIIDELEGESDNLLEGPRAALVRFVADRVAEYTRRSQFAISRYEADRLTEELVDELVGFGPLEVLLRDRTVSEILVNGPQRIFIERNGVLQHSD